MASVEITELTRSVLAPATETEPQNMEDVRSSVVMKQPGDCINPKDGRD